MAWSPEQISHRLKVDFPDDESMRISHEAIYQSLFIEGRGALKRELVACLRTGRALREPRARSQNKPQGHVTADVVLSERPAEAADRAVPGHWEGDLIIGTGRSAIGTLVERSSRSTLLVHLPRLEGWGEKPPVKNGPSLGGYGAVAMNAALDGVDDEAARAAPQDPHLGPREGALRARPVRARYRHEGVLRRPALALAATARTRTRTGCYASTSRRAPTCPGGRAEDLEAVALAINNRPRKILGWKTPAEVFEEQLRSLQQPGVATTG